MLGSHASQAGIAWERFRSVSHFGALDGLRCLSILGVIWHHGPGIYLSGIGARGGMGVSLFFAISGFLITTLLLREYDRHGTISLSKFYLRRSLRIFPLYYAVLALYVGLVMMSDHSGGPSRDFLSNIPYFLTYTSNWFVGSYGTFAFTWSLAAEEQFYATWPWVVRTLSPRRAAWFVVALLVAVLAARWFGGRIRATDHPLPLTILLSVQTAICWGCLLSILLHHRRGYAAVWSLLGRRWTGVVIGAAILAALEAGQYQIAYLLFACLVGACVIREDSVLAPVLRFRVVAHIGTVSYGMYLFHGLVYGALDGAGRRMPGGWHAHGLTGFVAATALTVGVATLSYRYFERPFLRLKERFAS